MGVFLFTCGLRWFIALIVLISLFFWLRIGWLVARGCLLFVFVGYAHGGLFVALRFDCVLKGVVIRVWVSVWTIALVFCACSCWLVVVP